MGGLFARLNFEELQTKKNSESGERVQTTSLQSCFPNTTFVFVLFVRTSATLPWISTPVGPPIERGVGIGPQGEFISRPLRCTLTNDFLATMLEQARRGSRPSAI